MQTNPHEGQVRLYAFFNYAVDKQGLPFALCDKHLKVQPIPENCHMNKLADQAVKPCDWED